jgi:hypothetical protein
MNRTSPTYKTHRHPIEIVARAVWLYFRFNLSLRDVEEMLLERGIVVSWFRVARDRLRSFDWGMGHSIGLVGSAESATFAARPIAS